MSCCSRIVTFIGRFKDTLGLTLIPAINVLTFILGKYFCCLTFWLGLATIATLFSGFQDYTLTLETWQTAPLTSVFSTNSSSCPAGSTLVRTTVNSVSLTKWRSQSLCYTTIGTTAENRPANSACTTPLCGGVACLTTCAITTIAITPGTSTVNGSVANMTYPVVRFGFTNQTLTTRAIRVDSLSEIELFADNGVGNSVPRGSNPWVLYYITEVPWFQSSTCVTTRNEVLKRKDATLGYTTSQYLAFVVTLISTLLLTILVPICLICNGKLKQIWKPTEYAQELVDATLKFEQYCQANPGHWAEYQQLMQQRDHINHQNHGKPDNEKAPLPPTPGHLAQVEQLYASYAGKRGSRACIDFSETFSGAFGTLASILSFGFTLWAIIVAFQVKDFIRQVSTEKCGDSKTNDSILLLAGSMNNATTWLNIANLVINGVQIPINVISNTIGVIKYCARTRETSQNSVENKLAQG